MERLSVTSAVKQAFDLETMSTSLKPLVVHSFPVSVIPSLDSSIKRHRPALFVVHVPHQNEQLMSVEAFVDFVDRVKITRLEDVVNPRQIGRMLKYIDAMASRGFVRDALHHVFVRMSLRSTDATHVAVESLDLSMCIDDLQINGGVPAGSIDAIRAVVRCAGPDLDEEMNAAQLLLLKTLRGV
jgi:hypothetical protein